MRGLAFRHAFWHVALRRFRESGPISGNCIKEMRHFLPDEAATDDTPGRTADA
jgi:hypothetical protein